MTPSQSVRYAVKIGCQSSRCSAGDEGTRIVGSIALTKRKDRWQTCQRCKDTDQRPFQVNANDGGIHPRRRRSRRTHLGEITDYALNHGRFRELHRFYTACAIVQSNGNLPMISVKGSVVPYFWFENLR